MKNRTFSFRYARMLGVLTAMACSGWSGAAEPNAPASILMQGRAFELPAVDPADLPRAPRTMPDTIVLEKLVLRGNTVISTDELISLVANRLGKPQNAADLEDVRLALTRHYIERGYVNSGAVFADDAVAGNTLTLHIVEGRLGEIRLHGMEGLHEDYLRGRLAPATGAVLNLETLRERFQLLLDDPLFKRLNARLLPGASAGEAILDVEVERARPYQLSAFANNYRPPSIGASVIGLSGALRNLTGLGDVLELTLQEAQKTWSEPRTTIAWRAPLGTAGTWVAAQYDHGRSSVLEEPMQALNLKSVLDSREIGLGQTLFENLSHKFNVGLQYVQRENRTTLAGLPFSFTPGEPEGVTRAHARRFWQEYSYRTEQQVLAVRSTLTWTNNNLQEMSGLPGPSAPEAAKRYGLWLLQTQLTRQLSEGGTQLHLRGAAQFSDRRLLPLDRLAIGGIQTVRGYRENQMVRDTGQIFNVEVEFPLLTTGPKGGILSILPFYDFGRGRNHGEASELLTSAGVATRMRWLGWRFDVAVAKRLAHPVATNGGHHWQDKGLHMQLAYDFF